MAHATQEMRYSPSFFSRPVAPAALPLVLSLTVAVITCLEGFKGVCRDRGWVQQEDAFDGISSGVVREEDEDSSGVFSVYSVVQSEKSVQSRIVVESQ